MIILLAFLCLLSCSWATSFQTEEVVCRKARSLISNRVQVADQLKPLQLSRKVTKNRPIGELSFFEVLPLDRDNKCKIHEKYAFLIIRMYCKAFVCLVLQIMAIKFMDPASWNPSVSLMFPPILDILSFVIPFLWDKELWNLDFLSRMFLMLMHVDSTIYHYAIVDIHTSENSFIEFAIFALLDAAMSLGANDVLAKRLKQIEADRKLIK